MNFKECLERISENFLSDTIELFDLVLSDDVEDPQYSAIIVINRIWLYLQYKNMTNKIYQYSQVDAFIESIGYSTKDIEIFRKKAQDEYKNYRGEILDQEYLT